MSRHWGIKNRSHHVRDVALYEGRYQVCANHAPHVLAALRTVAISLPGLGSFAHSTTDTRWVSFDYSRGFELFGL